MLVNLFTTNPELNAKILTGYSAPLFESQICVDDFTNNERIYSFYDLSYTQILRFLTHHNLTEKYQYELRESKTHKLIKRNS